MEKSKFQCKLNKNNWTQLSKRDKISIKTTFLKVNIINLLKAMYNPT